MKENGLKVSPNEKLQIELFKKQELFIFGDIDKHIAKKVIKQLKYFANKDLEKKIITIYICSEGGCVNSAMAIYDEICLTKKNKTIVTVAVGEVASAAIFVLAAGDKRYAYENASFMIHPFVHNFGGGDTHYDVVSYIDYTKRQYKEIMTNLMLDCGKTVKIDAELNKIKDSLYMNTEEAIKYGLIHGEWNGS